MSAKKKIGIALVSVIALFLLFWLGNVLYCEALTAKYGDEFEDASRDVAQIMQFDDWKVLRYTEDYAEVYYYSDGGGCVISYRIENGMWQEQDWVAAWSDTGSADDLIWPYIR